MKTVYYFKFIVPSHYEIKHNTYKQAVRTAKMLKENIYLTIYSFRNTFGEPYSEVKLNFNENLETINKAKLELIKTFETLCA